MPRRKLKDLVVIAGILLTASIILKTSVEREKDVQVFDVIKESGK